MKGFFNRESFPFVLVGTVKGGRPYQDVRTGPTWIEAAVENYLNNPYLQPVSPCVVHVWREDFGSMSSLLAPYRDRGVTLSPIEPLAQAANEKARAFAEGYRKLVQETGFDLNHSPCTDEDYLLQLTTPADIESASVRAFAVLKGDCKCC